jgi:ParB/RepB/Spo0J family partition protein
MSKIENLTAGNVKAAMSEVGAGRSDMWTVPVNMIKVMEGFNVRVQNADYTARIEEIANSIIANGFLKDKPLTGYVAKEDGQQVIYVTDGHTRLRAVKLAIERGAEIESLPVITKPAGTSIEDLTVALVTSNNGRPLAPIEMAAVVKRLAGYGMAEEVIAKRIGVTTGYIKDLLLLMGAPKAIRKAVEDGKISAANAVAQMKKHGDKAADVIGSAITEAEEAGEGKVSKKTFAKKEKAAKRDLLAEGIEWISNREERSVKGFVEMLAFLTGAKVEDINEQLKG